MEQKESLKGIIKGQPNERQQYMEFLIKDILEDIDTPHPLPLGISLPKKAGPL